MFGPEMLLAYLLGGVSVLLAELTALNAMLDPIRDLFAPVAQLMDLFCGAA